jgi:hypothetical protein
MRQESCSPRRGTGPAERFASIVRQVGGGWSTDVPAFTFGRAYPVTTGSSPHGSRMRPRPSRSTCVMAALPQAFRPRASARAAERRPRGGACAGERQPIAAIRSWVGVWSLLRHPSFGFLLPVDAAASTAAKTSSSSSRRSACQRSSSPLPFSAHKETPASRVGDEGFVGGRRHGERNRLLGRPRESEAPKKSGSSQRLRAEVPISTPREERPGVGN